MVLGTSKDKATLYKETRNKLLGATAATFFLLFMQLHRRVNKEPWQRIQFESFTGCSCSVCGFITKGVGMCFGRIFEFF